MCRLPMVNIEFFVEIIPVGNVSYPGFTLITDNDNSVMEKLSVKKNGTTTSDRSNIIAIVVAVGVVVLMMVAFGFVFAG